MSFVETLTHAHQLVERLRSMQARFLHLESCETRISVLESENEKLSAKCAKLQDELDDLCKVSQIIAFQKENALLKDRMRILERQLTYARGLKQDQESQPPPPQQVELPHTIESPPQQEVELEQHQMIEKTIRGHVYYLDTLTHMLYSERESETPCGRLELTSEGKQKVVWTQKQR